MSETGLTVKQGELRVGTNGVQLSSLEDAYRFATAVIKSRMAPKGYDSPEQVLIGIQRGAEIGLPPMQALDSIAVINGRPTVWGDSIPGLVRASGRCEYLKEWVEGSGDDETAYCETKRKDESEPCRQSFSVRDAKAAGLLNKAGPWTQYRRRMLQVRARAWACRDTFADVLRGLQIREEVEDYIGPQTVGVIPETPAKRLPSLSDLPDPDEPVTDVEPEPSVEEPSAPSGKSFRGLRNALAGAETDEQIGGVLRAAGESKRVGKITDDEFAALHSEADDRRCALSEA